MFIVKTEQLTKCFGGNEIVSQVNMRVKQGEIYGFLGPNGAGKTTVLKMLTNLIQPTSGTIELFNEPFHYENAITKLHKIGSLIEYPIFYDKLTAQENLQYHCEYMGYYEKSAIDEALHLVELVGSEQKKVAHFSLGMRQRLGIARAIITKPQLLLLDEPINGLDPSGMKQMRNLFQLLSKEYGMTIIISSHLLSEIEMISDTIGVLHQGKLIKEFSMEEMRKEETDYLEIKTENVTAASYILEHHCHLQHFKVMDERTIRIYEKVSQNDIILALTKENIEIESIHKKGMALEEYFFNVINQANDQRNFV